MKILYLTNINDPILKTDKRYRKHIRSLLVSEVYSNAFKNNGHQSSDFDFLLSDNGNFTRLSKVAASFKTDAAEIDLMLDELEKLKKPTPAALIKKRIKLNREIIKACEIAAKDDLGKVTLNQLSILPTAMIGGEDTTIPVLQICGAFDNRLKKNVPPLKKMQNKTLNLYSKQYRGDFLGGDQLKKTVKYLVIHAVDYQTLEKALKNASKKIKYDAIALSLGAPLKSKRQIGEIKLKGKKELFEKNTHPESYILTITLLLALKNNLKANVPVHILGLGSPILILLAGYIFRKSKFITIDSTSTYTDDLEDDKIFGITKMNLYRLAASCILFKNPYKGTSPYFKQFNFRYKSNWKKLFGNFKKVIEAKNLTNDQKIEQIKKRIQQDTSLLKYNVPFFTPIKTADKKFVKELRLVRAFENYWANNSICLKLTSFKSDVKLTKYVIGEIERYKEYADPQYYDAVIACKKLIDMYE